MADAAGALREVAGLAPGNRTVHVMVEDASGTLWVGASDGLYRHNGDRLRPIQLSSDWPGNQVWAIVEDDQRFLWVNTDLGLLRIHPGEVAKATDPAHRIRYQFFDGNDGLAGASVEYLRAAKSSDSTLWFARGGALTAIEPAALAPTADAGLSTVQIESVETERGGLDITTARDLSAGTRRLDFTFSILHLSPTPRLRFRHRLDGFDRDWRDAGTRTTASYTNLPPASYRLVVEAYSTQGTYGTGSHLELRAAAHAGPNRGPFASSLCVRCRCSSSSPGGCGPASFAGSSWPFLPSERASAARSMTPCSKASWASACTWII